jgi:hypothetical protein
MDPHINAKNTETQTTRERCEKIVTPGKRNLKILSIEPCRKIQCSLNQSFDVLLCSYLRYA